MSTPMTSNQEADQKLKARQHWISILARSNADELESYKDALSLKHDFVSLRQPENGLVMVRGRAGGKGQRFNLGEATVTRCSIRLRSGEIGHGYVAGRSKKHAELAAFFDALLQSPEWSKMLSEKVIQPLEAQQKEKRETRKSKVASTKVDFFTMVRGEDE